MGPRPHLRPAPAGRNPPLPEGNVTTRDGPADTPAEWSPIGETSAGQGRSSFPILPLVLDDILASMAR